MTSILYLVRNPIGPAELDTIDRTAAVAVYGTDAAGSFTAPMRERLVRRRHMAIAAMAGAVTGSGSAVALLSDFFALDAGATLDLGAREPSVAADILTALSWRIGSRVVGLLALQGESFGAAAAAGHGLVDALVPPEEDSLEWARRWLEGRSLVALQSAAALLRRRAGDEGEKAEFARLFAAGVPQQGLNDFLMKRTPGFSETVQVETI